MNDQREADRIEHLLRNWVDDSTALDGMSLYDMVAYALREEESKKIAFLKERDVVRKAKDVLLNEKLRIHGYIVTGPSDDLSEVSKLLEQRNEAVESCHAATRSAHEFARKYSEAVEQRDTLRRAIGIIMLLSGKYGSEEEIQAEIDRLAQP